MKKFLAALAIFALLVTVSGGIALLLMDSPMKTLESFAIRHADKLPLEYLGKKTFDRHCASCHDNPAMHAPTRQALAGFSKETIMIALEFGKMQPMAAHLSKQQRGLIALYLAGSAPNQDGWIAQNQCQQASADNTTEYVGNWGLGPRNQRFVASDKAGINRHNDITQRSSLYHSMSRLNNCWITFNTQINNQPLTSLSRHNLIAS